MIKLEICMGSSCYTKGSASVVEEVKKMIQDNGWGDKVELKGAFCMKACQGKIGLGVKLNGEPVQGLTKANAVEVLQKEISKALA